MGRGSCCWEEIERSACISKVLGSNMFREGLGEVLSQDVGGLISVKGFVGGVLVQ